MRITLLVIVMFFCLPVEVWAQDAPPAAVAVTTVIEAEVAAGQSFIGAVMPSRKSVIGSAVDGRVVQLLVNEGDPVTTSAQQDPPKRVGQPIAQLLTETISIEIAGAGAELALRQEELAELEAGTRPEEVEQARAKLEATKALMEFSQKRYERLKQLYEDTNTASLEEFEESLSAATAAEQNHLAAKAAHKLAVKGPRQEQIAQARARVLVAQEELRRLEDQKAKYTIRAPFDGYVIAKHTEIGAWLSRGDPVAEVVQLDPIEVHASVPESYIAGVHLGDAVRVRLDAVPDHVILGEVTRIVPQADLRSRTFPVIIRLENPKRNGDRLLKAGMLADVALGVGQPRRVLLIPKDALVLAGATSSIVIINDVGAAQPIARVVPVQLGVAQGSLIQVNDPQDSIRAGQHVVVRGNERLRSGQPVEIVQFVPTSND